jgi:hypothetical protein
MVRKKTNEDGQMMGGGIVKIENILSAAWALVWMTIWGFLAATILPNMFISGGSLK